MCEISTEWPVLICAKAVDGVCSPEEFTACDEQ
jgi:hypothetical protein